MLGPLSSSIEEKLELDYRLLSGSMKLSLALGSSTTELYPCTNLIILTSCLV